MLRQPNQFFITFLSRVVNKDNVLNNIGKERNNIGRRYNKNELCSFTLLVDNHFKAESS